jgi:hypothetical protein
MATRLLEHEQHALISGEVGASHQAVLALLLGRSNLDPEGVRADAQGQSRVSGAGRATQQ